MLYRSSFGVLLALVTLTAGCGKNDGRSPGIIEGVAGDVENEIDGAGNTVDGVGKDVTNTLDGTPPSPAPAADEASSDEAVAPATDDAADEAPSGD